ncbi:MAG: hypothetical protein QGH40_14865, partial [bacterium]|nr:hypothetical protein [bacterium]
MKRPIILLSLFNVLFRASSNILWLALLTLLLKSAGVQALPWLYTISNLLLISIFYFFKGTLRKRIGQPLLSLTTRILVLASLVGSFMLDTENSLVFLVTLIILVQSDEICGLSFAKTVSEHLNLKEAKRWQPVIFAAGSVGLCISGLMLKILLDIISLKELLWCTSILFLLVDVILSRLKKTTGSKEDVSVPKPDSVPVDQPTHVSPFSHPLVRLLIFSIIFRVVTKFPVDFLYSDQINRHFTSTKDLAAFMGMFSASIDLVVIVIQTLVAGWAFSNFPVGKILLILPITMSTLCLVSIFHTSFILTVSLQFSLLILARALNNPGNYILLGAVPKNKRTDYFRSIFLAKTISTLTAGTILIFAKDYFSPVYFYMVLAVINVIFLCITFGIDSAYFKTLKLTIRDTRGTGDPDMIESLKFVAVKDRIPEFKTLLRHSDSSVRLKTVEEVSLMDSETIQELLLPVLEVETDSRCLTA